MRIFSLCATLLTVVVIIWGAYTRLVDAGLGCPDWPGCYGFLSVPETQEEIKLAEERFPDTPVEVEKAWPEVIHRYFASSLGFVILIMTAWAGWKWRQQSSSPGSIASPGTELSTSNSFIGHSFLLLVLVIIQGLFGMWTVTLKLWPQVVTAHLLGGFTTLSLLWLLFLRSSSIHWQATVPSSSSLSSPSESGKGRLGLTRKIAVLALVLVVFQIALGGWTSSNYAALACPDFPTCQLTWLPDMNFAEGFNIFQQVGPNYLGGIMESDARIAIHFSHRVGALFVTVSVLALMFLLWRLPYKESKKMVLLLGFGLAVQISLGISNIIFVLPLSVAVAHNAIGALLLLIILTINYQLHRVSQRPVETTSNPTSTLATA